MLKLSNIRIPVRIAIACLLPLLAFTGFAVNELLDKRETFSTMQHVAIVVEAAPVISKLIADLQAERGPTGGFVEAKGKASADNMRSARPATDKSLANWNQHVAEYSKAAAGTKFAKNLEAANARLNDLASMRASADALTTDFAKATEWYTATISSLIWFLRKRGCFICSLS